MLTAHQTGVNHLVFRRNMQINQTPDIILIKWQASYPQNDRRHYKMMGITPQNYGRHFT